MASDYISVTRTRRGLGRPETARLVKRAILTALSAEGVEDPCIVDVTLTDDETIHGINLSERGVDRPTDVLSFPLNELSPGQFDPEGCERDMDTGALFLGDMVISIPRCEEQGEEYGHGYKREVSYLAVHSTLHLLGYDHVDEGPMKAQMRSREDAIMDILNIKR
ncbi:MAG: rRNA maturation RNase YbeY [Oscillospiraceae bacterium]|nr:rRNA maturation RNase YbeY [Oscillospiraceae bacterium]